MIGTSVEFRKRGFVNVGVLLMAQEYNGKDRHSLADYTDYHLRIYYFPEDVKELGGYGDHVRNIVLFFDFDFASVLLVNACCTICVSLILTRGNFGFYIFIFCCTEAFCQEGSYGRRIVSTCLRVYCFYTVKMTESNKILWSGAFRRLNSPKQSAF